MIDLNITNEELDALKVYMNNNYEAINQILVSNTETDIALLSEDIGKKAIEISYSRNSVIECLKNIKLIYKLMLKQYYKQSKIRIKTLYRGTNLLEIERLKNELFVDRFLIVTENQADAESKYSLNWNRPTCMNIALDEKVPFIHLKDVLENCNDEILISPFTKIRSISEGDEKKVGKNAKTVKNYNVELEKQNLDELTDRERNCLYDYILENTYSINKKIEECIELEKENTVNFENIRKLEQLLNKYENNEDVEEDFENINSKEDDILRVTKELEELKEKTNQIFEKRKQNIEYVNIWKRNIAVYMMAECKEIEKRFEGMEVPKCEIIKNEIVEKDKKNEETEPNKENKNEVIEVDKKQEEIEIKEDEEKISEKEEIEKILTTIAEDVEKEIAEKEGKIEVEEDLEEDMPEDKESIEYITRSGCIENIKSVKKLLNDISTLITKQQNHAKIAGNMEASYSALNNAFEMRKSSEKLLELLENINLEVKGLVEKKKTVIIEEKLNRISKNNLEISTLINYLNNPKIATRNSKITRFEEMEIIEENELKKGIAEKIRFIRGEAELKKLKDDLEIIRDKGTLSRLFGFFTGQNKLDSFMIEQIEIRQSAIRKTLSKKLSLAHNYSIHELMAEIKMFVEENTDDELVENDVKILKELAQELKRNYVILDSKVASIVQEKEAKSLPIRNKKITKKEIIELETYRFLKKYGYDNNSSENEEEPKYQDTMTSEINRIIEYVNSSLN